LGILIQNRSVQPDSNISKHPTQLPSVLIMVCIYIFLVIERPWESIRYLESIPIERGYAITLIIVALLTGKFRIVASPTNKWIYGLLTIHFVLAPFAFNTEFAIDQGIEYAKMVILYLLIISVAEDEESLKLLLKAFVISTMIYSLHSLWEYHNGRHLFRMGISRMMGVDSTFNDPNSFGASVVLSLPSMYALLRCETNDRIRKFYYLSFVLSVTCVVLTGSRTSFVALLTLVLFWIITQKGVKKIVILITSLVLLSIIWNAMPLEKQNRFETLWDENAGPANAEASAEGRLLGWKASWRMFKSHPLTGIGAGGKNYIGYRMTHNVDDGPPSANQSHFLYGEVLAEVGVFGSLLFLGLIVGTWRCCTTARKRLVKSGMINSFSYCLSGAVIASLLLLLVFGLGGHNFYRPLWLWLAAWAGALFNNTSQLTVKI
jgi:hypothetical protein